MFIFILDYVPGYVDFHICTPVSSRRSWLLVILHLCSGRWGIIFAQTLSIHEGIYTCIYLNVLLGCMYTSEN